MNYQVLKSLKTKNKLVKICNSLKEAHETIKATGASFTEISYFGGFPTYADTTKKAVYQIQGKHAQLGFVLSLDKKELSTFNFNQ